MASSKTLSLRTDPADFTVLASAMFTVAREMGKNMERTARSPIYFSAHDFVTTLVSKDCELIALAEYIPVLVGAAPFAVKAIDEFFQDDVHEGDVFLVNDPYSLDAGNQMADWAIVYPIFWSGKHVMWVSNKAHQQDTGGGAPGGYNPGAMDIYGEGLRIPPLKVFERGVERKDVFNLLMTNVRIPITQRGDLLSMIGAARVAERRVRALYDLHGEEKMATFVEDILEYGEFMMREEIAEAPDGTYHSELLGGKNAPPIVCDLTIKGDEMTMDLSGCGPHANQYVNSPIANTTSAVYMALLTSLGKKIPFKCGGAFRPISLITNPGAVAHALPPVTHANCTNFVAKQIIEVVWDAVAQAYPQDTPAGWGPINPWVIAGLDPRRMEGYGTPDFLSCASGAGAIWGVDGWNTNAPQICSGTLYYPEVEVAESIYPMVYERWQLAIDSAGAGKWRGGLGTDTIWTCDSGPQTIFAAYQGEPYGYRIAPAIAGGEVPKPCAKSILLASGKFETNEDILARQMYVLQQGDKVIDYNTGGAGVGNPFDRDVAAVRDDVVNGLCLRRGGTRRIRGRH